MALFFVGVAVGTSGGGGSATTRTTADAKPASVPTVTTTETVTARPAAEPPDDRTAVPKFVGMGLQAAQDKAQSVGFYLLKSHDSTDLARRAVSSAMNGPWH
ncbi:hypothetical protein [Streptomyces sp. NRRL F-5126]|uniref:hypothetical protein n=1 Tax=Streptomyces sp. NRRL F-5126 TaxID=1463857 RepID=UPI0004CC3167|nr:hypothetical protein [Streptomyces sp. NRRL F-5126]